MKFLLFFFLSQCYGCNGNIPVGSFGVVAPKFGENVQWHPACFQCTTCAELLVDLTYCVHEDQLYCERHYAEQLKPRCAACDEVNVLTTRWQAAAFLWHARHSRTVHTHARVSLHHKAE